MKRIFFLIIVFSLLFSSAHQAQAQSLSTTKPTESTFQLPQWAKDLRRWDIIAFGAFPFSMFFVMTVTDILRWKDANNFDFSEDGRRYAPWPLKSAGAVEMTNDEYTRTIWLAVGVSAVIASVDLLIIIIKRANERKRIESLPSGSTEINKSPYGTIQETDDSTGAEETGEK
jgi:ABC-type Fe3+ transport system permease subunit